MEQQPANTIYVLEQSKLCPCFDFLKGTFDFTWSLSFCDIALCIGLWIYQNVSIKNDVFNVKSNNEIWSEATVQFFKWSDEQKVEYFAPMEWSFPSTHSKKGWKANLSALIFLSWTIKSSFHRDRKKTTKKGYPSLPIMQFFFNIVGGGGLNTFLKKYRFLYRIFT